MATGGYRCVKQNRMADYSDTYSFKPELDLNFEIGPVQGDISVLRRALFWMCIYVVLPQGLYPYSAPS